MEKVLGIVWFFEKDIFIFKIKIELVKGIVLLGDFDVFILVKLIKCLILSKLVGIFDLVGVGVVVFIKFKIVM